MDGKHLRPFLSETSVSNSFGVVWTAFYTDKLIFIVFPLEPLSKLTVVLILWPKSWITQLDKKKQVLILKTSSKKKVNTQVIVIPNDNSEYNPTFYPFVGLWTALKHHFGVEYCYVHHYCSAKVVSSLSDIKTLLDCLPSTTLCLFRCHYTAPLPFFVSHVMSSFRTLQTLSSS